MKKKMQFDKEPPTVSNVREANALIRELWAKLRDYQDQLDASSRNSSRSPSSDTPQAKAERKKLKRLVAEIRLENYRATHLKI
jgi:hypothetical protein